MSFRQISAWVGLLVVLTAINLKLAAQDPTCNKSCGFMVAGDDEMFRFDSHRSCCLGPLLCHVSNCPITVRGCSDTITDICGTGLPESSFHFCRIAGAG